jgi:hypothetical protein
MWKWLPANLTGRKLCRIDQKIKGSIGDINSNNIAIFYKCDRSTINCLWRNVTYTKSSRSARETTVGKEQS